MQKVKLKGFRIKQTEGKYSNDIYTFGPLNIEDGSQSGSLRTTGATEEDENNIYTIGEFAFAEGFNTQASGNSSHAEGNETLANGDYSHSQGYNTQAIGVYSHSEGNNTQTEGEASHAQNTGTIALGNNQTVLGRYNQSNSQYAVIIGNGSDNTHRSNLLAAQWNGDIRIAGNIMNMSGQPIYNNNLKNLVDGSTSGSVRGVNSTQEGIINEGTTQINYKMGFSAIAEGYNTQASGDNSHAEGAGSKASAICSHAEGGSTIASGLASHAEGGSTVASGSGSHAQGNGSKAIGESSHAQGNVTIANGNSSHAQNFQTIASSNYQTAIGKYNIEDSDNIYSLIIGNGDNNARSNALTVDWNGNVVTSGGVTTNGDIIINNGGQIIDNNGNPIYNNLKYLVDGSSLNSLRGTSSEEQNNNYTIGEGSVTLGNHTKAVSNYQVILGKYNIEDSNNKKVLIIGNGTNSTRSNAFSVDWDGKTSFGSSETVVINPVNTSADHIIIGNNTSSNTYSLKVQNSLHALSFNANTSGNAGIWDMTNSKWMVRNGIDGITYLGNTTQVYVDNTAFKAGSVTVSGSISTNNKTSKDDQQVGVYINNAGNIHLTGDTNSGSGIYFYFNKSSQITSYIQESASGTLKLSNDVSINHNLYVDASTYITGALGTGGRTSYDDGTNFGCWLSTNGEVHLASSATSGGAIGFHYNKTKSVTSYIKETANGTITVGGHLKIASGNNIYVGSAIGTGGRTSNTDVSTSGSWLTSDGCLSFVRNATSGGLIQFHFNSAASATSTIDEIANGRLKVSGELYTGGHIVIDTNAKYIYSKFADNTNRILCGVNVNNDNLFGYGSFHDSIGSTHLQGNTVYIQSKGDIYLAPNSTTWLTVSAGGAAISTTTANKAYFKVKNNFNEGSLYASDAGKFGIYSNTANQWLIYTEMQQPLIYLPIATQYQSTAGKGARIGNNGELYCQTSSSKRYKHDIKPLQDYRQVLDISAVSFKYNDGYLIKNDPLINVDVPGFIAEDVAEHYPIAVEYNENGQVENWNIRHIVPAMLAVEQDHDKQIQLLIKENKELKQKLNYILSKIS